MHIVKLIGLISWILFFSGQSMPVQKNRITWLSLQEAEIACKKEQRPILIDLYTDWCGWCKVMDKKTYRNNNVSTYLSEKFYAVKLNAESREPVLWQGKVYTFNTSNNTNNIALYLTEGKLAYPTTVIIPAVNSAPQAIPGYLSPKQIEIFLKFFGEQKYEQLSFTEYSRRFRNSWR